MTTTNNNPHTFALYWPDTSKYLNKKVVTLLQDDLQHRIVTVLRMEVGGIVVLFDREHHTQATITEISKKNITLALATHTKNSTLKPDITFFLPVLKRDDLETALYDLAACGLTEIQLITTQKSSHLDVAKQRERLQKICIAAAEQSKHFMFPELRNPILLETIDTKKFDHVIFFDPSGQNIIATMESLKKNLNKIGLIVGPEGDLTPQEKIWLSQQNIVSAKLTPTILRACQAASLATGIVRSYYNKQ